jgi:RNA polymerase sigma factor (sigma-70 family)
MSESEPADLAAAPSTDPDPAVLPPDLRAVDAAVSGRDQDRRLVEAAFSDFYRSEINRLIRYVMRQGADAALAGEVAQESMFTAYRAWSTIRHPKAWVYKVARNAFLRHAQQRREDPVGVVPEPTALLPRSDALMAVELRHDALRAIRSLPPRQREVITLSLSGFTPADIAVILGIEPNTVSANLLKARRTLIASPEFREEYP